MKGHIKVPLFIRGETANHLFKQAGNALNLAVSMDSVEEPSPSWTLKEQKAYGAVHPLPEPCYHQHGRHQIQ